MKSLLTWLFLISMLPASAVRAQDDDDKEMAEALQKANEAAKGMGLKVTIPDAKQIMADQKRKEAEHKKKQIAAAKARGPLTLPDWTPAVPGFTPDGPVSIRNVGGDDQIAQSGTSPQTPAQIADAWDAAKKDGWSRSRSNTSVNGHITIYFKYYKNNTEPRDEVKLIAERGPEDKVTKVTLCQPLPEIPDDDD